jgi:tyrosinase
MQMRKNVKNLSSTDREKFVNAILKLKKAPSLLHPDDSTYGRYDDYVEIHMHAMMVMSPSNPADDPDWYPGWAHNGPAFLPWHRIYLLQFEKDLQSISKDNSVTVPYWDWTDNDSSPFSENFMGTNGEEMSDNSPGKVIDGPFAYEGPNHWTLVVKDSAEDPNHLTRGFGRRPDARRLPTSVQVDRVMQVPLYDSPVWKLGSPGFRTGVEVPLHNLVHRWVNGTMLAMTSPNDPVFWLHHSNIDKLWGDWQRLHPTICPFLPSKYAPEGHNLYDMLIFSDSAHDHTGIKSTRVVNTLNHYLLDYRYDSDPKEETIQILEKKIKIREKAERAKHKLSVFPTMDEII